MTGHGQRSKLFGTRQATPFLICTHRRRPFESSSERRLDVSKTGEIDWILGGAFGKGSDRFSSSFVAKRNKVSRCVLRGTIVTSSFGSPTVDEDILKKLASFADKFSVSKTPCASEADKLAHS